MKKYSLLSGIENTETIMTDVDILEFYWDFWSNQMQRAGKQDEISPEKCIEDFTVVHWAQEIEDEIK